MVSARGMGRTALRQEPYDPDAIDGDGDGIVQEGTAWERPAGTRLLDEFGRAIIRGISSGSRPAGMRVVDRGGTDVEYRPRYAVDSPEAPGKTPLGKLGYRSLRERGLSLRDSGVRSIGQITGRETLGQNLDEMNAVPEVTAAVTPDVPDLVPNIPESTDRKASPDADRINTRNKEIADTIAKAGGALDGDVSQEFVDAHQTDAGTAFSLETNRQAFDRRRKVMLDEISSIRKVLESGEAEESRPGVMSERFSHSTSAASITEQTMASISPQVKEMIRTKTDEELLEIMERRAAEFHAGLDKRVRVRIDESRLLRVLEDGRYKTTHEVASDHSGADIRSKYETYLGFPPGVDPTLRPASGYVVHPDWERAEIDIRASASGISPEMAEAAVFSDVANPAGNVTIYGNTEIVLKPEVASRTRYARGDSLTASTRPVPLDSEDPEAIMHAVTWAGGTTRGDSPLHTATLLQSEVDGNFGFLNTWHARWNDDGTRDASGGKNVRKYFEANIAGSFDVEDIEEIRIAASNLDALGKAADPEGMTDEALNASIANPERLRSMGFSDEQIAYIMDQYNSGGYGFTNWFNEYKTYLRRKRGQEAIDSMGTKVTIIGDVAGGRDPLDINSYGGNEGFSTIDELLASRVRQNVQAVMEAAARAASGDVYEEDEDVA